MTLAETITLANEADAAFSAACKAEGWKTRWDMAITPQHSQFLRDAYFAKVDADKMVHDAFEQARAKQ